MTEPIWRTTEIVFEIHAELLSHFGGREGLRDLGLLEAALDRPRNRFVDRKKDIAALAAAYAFGLSRGHAFIDGNKRIALAATIVFLGQNGRAFAAPEAEATVMMVGLAAGEVDEDRLADWIARNS